FRTQASDRRVDAVYIRRIGETRPLLLGLGPRQRLSRGFEVAGIGIERRLRDDPLSEQLGLAAVVLLRQIELRVGFVSAGGRLIERGLELPHVLLGFSEQSLFLVDDVLVRLRVDAEQHVPFLERHVRLHRHLDHAPPDRRKHGRHGKIDAGIFRKRMIVVHDQQQQCDADDPAQRRRRKRPLVGRYPEYLEGYVADRDVDQDEQEFHYCSPVLILLSSAATRRRKSSSSFTVAAGSAPAPADRGENPQPRSGRYVIAQIQRNGHSTCNVNRLTHPAAWIASWWG